VALGGLQRLGTALRTRLRWRATSARVGSKEERPESFDYSRQVETDPDLGHGFCRLRP